jgi:stage III sporulation protein AG
MKTFFTDLKTKFKENKKLQIAVVLTLIVAMFAIYFSTLGGKSSGSGSAVPKGQMTAETFAGQLERKLSSVLSQVAGAGKVDVMITLEGGPTYEIAYTTEERRTNGPGGESVTLIKTPILITKNGVSQPIILSETNPKILGVIVVAQGAGDMRVKMDLLRASEAVLKVPVNAIEIFVGRQ